jgi:hypothetical protein
LDTHKMAPTYAGAFFVGVRNVGDFGLLPASVFSQPWPSTPLLAS